MDNLLSLGTSNGTFMIFNLAFILFGVAFLFVVVFQWLRGEPKIHDNFGKEKPLASNLFRGLQVIGLVPWIGWALIFFVDDLVGPNSKYTSEHLLNLCWVGMSLTIGAQAAFFPNTINAIYFRSRDVDTGFISPVLQRAADNNRPVKYRHAMSNRMSGIIFMVIGAVMLLVDIIQWPQTLNGITYEVAEIQNALRTGVPIQPSASPISP